MLTLDELVQFVFLSMAVGAVAFTIARTKITEPLRKKVAARSDWLGKLVHCPYCLSHWLSFGAVGVYRLEVIDGSWIGVNMLVTAMAMVALAIFVAGVIQSAMMKG